MKNIRILAFTALLLGAALVSYAQKKDPIIEMARWKQGTQPLVESARYEVEVTTMNPSGGRPRNLDRGAYYIRVDKDSASIELPFMGRSDGAYSPSGDGNISADGPLKDYQVKYDDKKMAANIRFDVRTMGDNYRVTLTVLSNGSVLIGLSSNTKSYISYNGDMIPLKNKQ